MCVLRPAAGGCPGGACGARGVVGGLVLRCCWGARARRTVCGGVWCVSAPCVVHMVCSM